MGELPPADNVLDLVTEKWASSVQKAQLDHDAVGAVTFRVCKKCRVNIFFGFQRQKSLRLIVYPNFISFQSQHRVGVLHLLFKERCYVKYISASYRLKFLKCMLSKL